MMVGVSKSGWVSLVMLGVVSVQAGDVARGDCCEGRGIVAGHVFGILFAIVFGEGIAAFCRGLFPLAYKPASSLFCQRILFQVLLDLGYVLLSLLSTDDVSDAERRAYHAFIGCHVGIFAFLVVYWSCKSENIFLGGRAENARREELLGEINKARSTITGHKLINDSLRREVEAFNRVLYIKYRMTKGLSKQILLFRVVVIAFVVHQYVNLCEYTLCSFYKQLAVVLSISSMFVGLEDVWILQRRRAQVIELSQYMDTSGHQRGDGARRIQISHAEPLEAYTSIRDLVVELTASAQVCVNELAHESQFEHMSVARYGWDQNPADDPRIDVCTWFSAYAMLLVQDAREGAAVSVTGVHLMSAAGEALVRELVGAEPEEQVLLSTLSLLHQVGFPLLSAESRGKFDSVVGDWAKRSRSHNNPRRYALGVLYDSFMPREFKDEMRPAEEDLDEALVDYLTLESSGLRDRAQLLVRDDALVEWTGVTFAHMRNTILKGHGDVSALQRSLETVGQQMLQSKLVSVVTSLYAFGAEVQDKFGDEPGVLAEAEAVQRLKQELASIAEATAAEPLASSRNSSSNNNNMVVVLPAINCDRIPAQVLRYGKPELVTPVPLDALAKALGDQLDLRPFGRPNSALVTTVGLRDDSNKHTTAADNGGAEDLGKRLVVRFQKHKQDKALLKQQNQSKRRKSHINVRSKEVSLKVPTWEAFKDFFIDHVFFTSIVLAWIGIFIRGAAQIGNKDESAMDRRTFLGLPPTYDLDKVPLERVMIPLTYGVMHGNLVFMTLLPLTMSRWTIRQLSRFELVSRVLRIEHCYNLHKRCGYNVMWGVLVGAVFWWIGVQYACTEHRLENACEGFYPRGSYIDIYNNLAAVVFLRELVCTTTLAMLITSGLIFPRGLGRSTPFIKVNKAYELFYYTHIVGAVALASLAFSSRFEVFYPVVGPWCWYAMDVCVMFIFNTRKTIVAGAVCFAGGNNLKPALFLRLKKPRDFRFEAGQTAFIKIPKISKLEWHPFSIASSPFDDYVEFLIDCGHGPRTWTKRLFDLCANARIPDKYGRTIALKPLSEHDKKANSKHRNLGVYLYGPCGSSFQAFDEHEGALLIGGGSGLPSSLSVLRHVFHLKSRNKSSKLKRVHFVWSTREFESLMWCWGHLKDCIERQCGYNKLGGRWTSENDEALQALDWLDITINSTRMDRESMNRLMDIERDSVVGGYLVQRLRGGRITNWSEIFNNFERLVQSHDIKAFFCGPTEMAKVLRQEAKKITSFKIEVSSENFHDS